MTRDSMIAQGHQILFGCSPHGGNVAERQRSQHMILPIRGAKHEAW